MGRIDIAVDDLHLTVRASRTVITVLVAAAVGGAGCFGLHAAVSNDPVVERLCEQLSAAGIEHADCPDPGSR